MLNSVSSQYLLPFLSLLLVQNLPFSIGVSPHPLLLLVSFDGFRWDFLDEGRTPNLWRLANDGVRFSKGVRSQMITVTAPNHYSIATGLYEESHGIVDNDFYDPEFGEVYDLWNFTGNSTTYNRSKLGKWYKGEPIWITNQRAAGNRFSGSLAWPSADANISGVFPEMVTTWKEYGNSSVWKKEFDNVLDWFMRPEKPVNLGLWYVAQPDHVEHKSGVLTSNETMKIVKDLDELVGYMVSRLKEVGFYDKLNLVLTTDHGHSEIRYPEHEIPIVDYVQSFSEYSTKNLVFMGGGVTVIDATPSRVEEIFVELRTKLEADYKNGEINVMRKRDFPNSQYHWTDDPRVTDILLFTKIGYGIEYKLNRSELAKQKHKTVSTHGYFPGYKEMRGYLVLQGPAFRKNVAVEVDFVENIDLYPLMCKVLELTPAPNNASLERISMVFKSTPDTVSMVEGFLSDNKAKLVVIFAIIIPTILFLCYLMNCMMTRQHSSSNYRAKAKHRISAHGYERLQNSSAAGAASGSSYSNGPTGPKQPNLQNGRGEQGDKPLLLLSHEDFDSMSENEL